MIAAGPTAVHSSLESESVWPRVKMRKLVLASSLPSSPRPEVGNGFWKAQRPTIEGAGASAACRRVGDDQRPGPRGVQARERRQAASAD